MNEVDDELLNTLQRIFEQKGAIRQMKSDEFVVQTGACLMQMSKTAFCKLCEDIRAEPSSVESLLNQFEAKDPGEYIVVAYHEGKILGTKMKPT